MKLWRRALRRVRSLLPSDRPSWATAELLMTRMLLEQAQAQASSGKDLAQLFGPEVATARRTELGWYAAEEDPHPSAVLEKFSEGADGIGDLYLRMIRDADLVAMIGSRNKAVVQLPRQIEPRDGTAGALEAKRFVEAWLRDIKVFQELLIQYLWSRQFGVRHIEYTFERISRGDLTGSVVPVDWKNRPMRRFGFVNGEPRVRDALGKLKKFHPLKISVIRSGSRDTGWGSADLDPAFFPWKLKRHGWELFAKALELWGIPILKGTFPAKNKDLRSQLEEMIKRFFSESQKGLLVPEGTDIGTLEWNRGGSVSHSAVIHLCLQSYARLQGGETESSGADNRSSSSYASKEASLKIRSETTASDSNWLATTVADEVIAPVVAYNLGPPDKYPPPRMYIDAGHAEDRERRQKGLKAFFDICRENQLHLPVDEGHMRRVFGARAPREWQEVPGGVMAGGGEVADAKESRA